MTGQTATADVNISASPAQVWQALTEPEQIKAYFFGAEVQTTWEEGTPITWHGEYDGQQYADKGEVLEVDPPRRLCVSHYSPLSGRPDTPENYHRVTWQLGDDGDHTRVQVDQSLLDGDSEDQARDNWTQVLRQLKEHVERG